MSEPLPSSSQPISASPDYPSRRSEKPLQSLVNDFKALPFDVLFPFQRWLSEQPWKMRWVQVLLAFALFPLSLTYILGDNAQIHDAAWAIGGYFSLIWGYVLWLVVKPGTLNTRNLLSICGFTAIIGIMLVLLLQQLPFISTLYAATEWGFSPLRLIGFVAGVGVLEEAVKLLPVFWLAVKMQRIRTPREAAFYAGISGLAFGVAEAVSYSINYTNINTIGMAYGMVGSGNYVVLEFLRLITLPFLHCVFTGVAGYYLGLSLLSPQRRTALILLGLAVAAVMHGLYDFLAGSWLSVAEAALSILIFVAYIRSAEHITQHITGQDLPEPNANS